METAPVSKVRRASTHQGSYTTKLLIVVLARGGCILAITPTVSDLREGVLSTLVHQTGTCILLSATSCTCPRALGAAPFCKLKCARCKQHVVSTFQHGKPFSLELSVSVDTGLGVWFVILCCCRDPCDCLSPVLVRSLPLLLSKDFWSGMGSDGFQTQRRGSWIPGKEKAETALADAISTDGRKEWICKFCLESNVWTRWRFGRCCTNIPSGLRGEVPAGSGSKDRRMVNGLFDVEWRGG